MALRQVSGVFRLAPFFVEEVHKHLADEGRLFDDDGEFRAAIEDPMDVPETLWLILGRRLEHLGVGARRALKCAAVAGRAFDADQLAAMGGTVAVDLLDALEEAEDARLILPADALERTAGAAAPELAAQIAQHLLARGGGPSLGQPGPRGIRADSTWSAGLGVTTHPSQAR